MKENKEYKRFFEKTNVILLGLLMLIPGLMKLFSPDAAASMLTNLGFPIVGFFLWLLILAEIGSGIAILTRWKLNSIKYIPIIILTVAILTAHLNNYLDVLIRLVVISNYLLLRQK